MKYSYLANITGGIGPDVWDRELEIVAEDFMDAAKQATDEAKELRGQVVLLEQFGFLP